MTALDPRGVVARFELRPLPCVRCDGPVLCAGVWPEVRLGVVAVDAVDTAVWYDCKLCFARYGVRL